MEKYYIDTVIIKGHSFELDEPLCLEDAIELAKELSSHGYVYHISEKISDNHYRYISLGELEKKLKIQIGEKIKDKKTYK